MFSKQYASKFLWVFWLLGLGLAQVQAQVSLVLGGGGARGVAHVLVLEALVQAQVPVERVIGTSMGAVIGGLFAAGFSPAEIAEAIKALDWEAVFQDAPAFATLPLAEKQQARQTLPKPELGFDGQKLRFAQGLVAGQQFDLILRRLFLSRGVRTFADLPLPFTAVATDLETGERVLLQSGDVVTAIRASLSVPGFFAPVRIDSRLLVDGGIASNVPIAVAKAQSAAPVVAVSLDLPLKKAEALTSPLAIGLQVVDILVAEQVQRELALLSAADILLKPQLTLLSTDFPKIVSGLEEVSQQLPDFVAALAPQSRPTLIKTPPVRSPPRLKIQQVQFVIDEVAKAPPPALQALRGQPFQATAVEAAIADLYVEGGFEKIGYDLQQDALIVTARRKPFGPGFIRTGLFLDSDFAGRNRYAVGLFYQQKQGANQRWQLAFTSKDAETTLEGHRQVATGKGRWLGAQLRFSNARVDFYRAGQLLGDGQSQAALLGLTWTQKLGKVGELQVLAGFQWQRDDVARLQGEPLTLGQGLRSALRLQYDTLDAPFLPKQGQAGEFLLRYGDGRHRLWQARWQQQQVATWADTTLTWRLQLAASSKTQVPIAERFALGGREALLAFGEGELPGYQLWYSGLTWEKPWKAPFLLGLTLEAAEVWQQQDRDFYWSAGVTVRRPTPLGELFLGYALSEAGNQRLYFSLGTKF
jgi:NTE family protein